MLHSRRCWTIGRVESAEELARMLTEQTWCLCNGFELDGYWFLNDATHEDGGSEYAIVKKAGSDGRPVQVESITFSWCDYATALEYIRRTLRGEDDDNSFAREVDPHLQTPEEHGRCMHCA